MSGPRRKEWDDNEEEILNLDDPNMEFLDNACEEEQALLEAECESTDDDSNAVNDAEENGIQAEVAEDLNEVPDREPSWDGAFSTFSDPNGKPLHAIASHPMDPLLFAASGEGEVIYILRVAHPLVQDSSSLPRPPMGVDNLGNNAIKDLKDKEEEEENAVEEKYGTTCTLKSNAPVLVCTLHGHTDTVSLLEFSGDGQWLASGSLDSTVGLWSTKSWERVHCFSDLYGEPLSLLWHPSSLLLVASSSDDQAVMWNILKGSVVMFYAGHRGGITTLSWSSDVKKLITGSSDGTISVFNPKTGVQELNVAKDVSPDQAGVTAMCVVGNDQVVVGCEDGTLHVVSLSVRKVVMHMEEIHDQAIESLQYHAHLHLLLSSSCDCQVVVWNTAGFSPRTCFHANESVIPCIWVKDLLVAGCSDGQLRVWDGRATEQEPLATLDGHRRMIYGLAVCYLAHEVTEGDSSGAIGMGDFRGNSTSAPNRVVVGTVSDDGCAKFFSLKDEFFRSLH